MVMNDRTPGERGTATPDPPIAQPSLIAAGLGPWGLVGVGGGLLLAGVGLGMVPGWGGAGGTGVPWVVLGGVVVTSCGLGAVGIAIALLNWRQVSNHYNQRMAHLEQQVSTTNQELSQQNEALRLAQETFTKAFQASPAPMTITTLADGRHLEVNRSFLQTTGYTREEVLGRTALELNLWVNWDDRQYLFEQLSQRSTIQNYEFQFRTKTGAIRTALLSTEIIELGNQSCLLAISNDITDRKLAEQNLAEAKEAADRANQAKSDFLARMSHELRTPLNAILGFAALLKNRLEPDPRLAEVRPWAAVAGPADPSPPSDLIEFVDIISKSGNHLLVLIADLLDLAKIEAGRLTIDRRAFFLLALLQEVIQLLRLRAEQKGLELRLCTQQGFPRQIKGDEKKLRQVLLNLLSNAVKFTAQGSVQLTVNAVRQETPADPADPGWHPYRLEVAVCDTGSGIVPQELASLFQPFTQTETGRQSQEGTGLGLSISHKFVELMGGTLMVNSIPGRGTCFSFGLTVEGRDGDELEVELFADRGLGEGEGGARGDRTDFSPDAALPGSTVAVPTIGLVPDDSLAGLSAAGLGRSSAELLEGCSSEWCQQLRQAALEGREQRILSLVAMISPTQPTLAQLLRQWTHDYRFDLIMALLEQNSTLITLENL
ncbi:MAG: ATP-binding protein [Prochlorothrix sp.]|nr:ATP-binding protein [Prochlorothrix sp.]